MLFHSFVCVYCCRKIKDPKKQAKFYLAELERDVPTDTDMEEDESAATIEEERERLIHVSLQK